MAEIEQKYADKSIKELKEFARASEAMERYQDMSKFMKLLIQKRAAEKTALDVEERNLFSVSYKNVVGSLRQSWRTITSPQIASGEIFGKKVYEDYRDRMVKEIGDVCKEATDLLIQHLVAEGQPCHNEDEFESLVFYYKMAGDYYRYTCEIGVDNKDEMKGKCEEMYGKAFDLAKAKMKETHPTRLGVALNMSVFHYEIGKDSDKACNLAKEAFDAAIEKLDTLSDRSYKDSTLIMQLLRDNLTLWTSEKEDEAKAMDP